MAVDELVECGHLAFQATEDEYGEATVAALGDLAMMLQQRLPVPLVRVAYRVAYRLAQIWWFAVRPDVHGVKGILRDGDRVLLVRHTYGDRTRWDIPGGHAHRGEPAPAAVRREMREELGLDMAWEPVGSLGAHSDNKLERVHCFVAPWPPGARLALSRGEIAEAQWFPLGAMPAPVGELSVRALSLLGDGVSSARGQAASGR
jgi:8-oxo-dGTP pyrophosphatase MutT (NUDIX family)